MFFSLHELFVEDRETGEKLSHDELVQEMIGLLLSGHETSSHSASWAVYYMTKNPGLSHLCPKVFFMSISNLEIVKSLRAHVLDVCGKNEIRYEDVCVVKSFRNVCC